MAHPFLTKRNGRNKEKGEGFSKPLLKLYFFLYFNGDCILESLNVYVFGHKSSNVQPGSSLRTCSLEHGLLS